MEPGYRGMNTRETHESTHESGRRGPLIDFAMSSPRPPASAHQDPCSSCSSSSSSSATSSLSASAPGADGAPPVAGAPNHATDEVEETEGTAAGSWLTPFLILGSSRPPLPVALKPPSVGAVSRTCSNLAGVKASKKGHRRHCGVAAARAPLWCRKSRRPSTRSLF